jgi:hypothetical protein
LVTPRRGYVQQATKRRHTLKVTNNFINVIQERIRVRQKIFNEFAIYPIIPVFPKIYCNYKIAKHARARNVVLCACLARGLIADTNKLIGSSA